MTDSLPGHLEPQAVICEEDKLFSERVRILERDKKSGFTIDDLVRRATAGRADRHQPGCHGFRDNKCEAFSAAGQHQNIGGPDGLTRILQKAGKMDRLARSILFGREGANRLFMITRPDEQAFQCQGRLPGADDAIGLEKKIMALDPGDPATQEADEIRRLKPEAAAGGFSFSRRRGRKCA